MQIRLVHAHYSAAHLDAVAAQMRQLGPPTIRAVDLGEGQYAALEGCHRLRAALELGLTPILELVEYSDESAPDTNDEMTVAQIVDRSWREVSLNFQEA